MAAARRHEMRAIADGQHAGRIALIEHQRAENCRDRPRENELGTPDPGLPIPDP